MTMVNSDPSKMNLSFSGCGFLCIYHAGVAAAIKEYAPQLTQQKISGASAGSIVAAGLVCNVCISEATSTILRVVTQARSRSLGPLHPQFNLLGLVRDELVRTLPPDAYIKCTDRLQISLTRWKDMKNVVVTEYKSNKELIDAIICSCYIPVYCGINPPKYRGEAYIDGGFTDNQPAVDEHTVSVSPFSGESDICPPDWDSSSFFGIEFSKTSIRFTTRNLFRLTACLMPPSTEDCSKMCLQGFEDALRFLTKNAMAPCIRCLTIQTDVTHPAIEQEVAISRTFSPPNRRPRSAANQLISTSSSRRRLESECDTCCESEHMYNSQVSDVFPSIMKRTLAEAAAAEDTIFKYLLSFRFVRYARIALGISKLPIEMMLIFAKNVIVWVNTVAAPQWLTDKLKAIVDLIYSEIDNQRSRYSARYSCQLAITEMDYEAGGQSFIKEHHGEIELSAEAQKEVTALRERDRRMRNKRSKSVTTTRSSNEGTPAPMGATVRATWEHDDVDSFNHVIEYTTTHDAMYAFHYLDENNKVRNIELFNVGHEGSHSCESPRNSRNNLAPRPISLVEEEENESESVQAEPATCSSSPVVFRESSDPKRDENDSGLSVEESISGTSKRDACCSPVRHFTNDSPRGSRSIRTSHPKRPHTMASQASRKPVCITATRDLVAGSSDSDADTGEKFFVPRCRQRTTSQEYDGEPEQSDTDHAM